MIQDTEVPNWIPFEISKSIVLCFYVRLLDIIAGMVYIDWEDTFNKFKDLKSLQSNYLHTLSNAGWLISLTQHNICGVNWNI